MTILQKTEFGQRQLFLVWNSQHYPQSFQMDIFQGNCYLRIFNKDVWYIVNNQKHLYQFEDRGTIFNRLIFFGYILYMK
jgi:hypothetical protein